MLFARKMKSSIAALLGIALLFGSASVAVADTPEQAKEVRQLLLDYHYNKPSADSLASDDIDQMIATLNDPWTQFFDAKEWESFNSALEQTFVGVGIVMRQDKGGVYIDDVIAGSPADSAGLLPGDLMVMADGKSVIGSSSSEIQQLLLGQEGELASLSVKRDGKRIDFIIMRQKLSLPVVTTKLFGDGVGYLALSGFTSDAAEKVKAGLAELEKQNITSLVFDLRGNGGGYVDAAQKIASLFIKDGVLAHMVDRDGDDTPLVVKGAKKDYPVVMLVNGNTASASELLSGALQDYGVARLVGAKTYGKGVVQSIVSLQSGGVLKLTVQQYFTPKGRTVNKVGLTPDIPVDDPASQLIEAYRAAGGHKVVLSALNDVVTMEGIRTAEPSAALKDAKGVWYVNIRLGASIAGAKFKYDATKRLFTLTKGKVVYTVKSNDPHLVVKNGRTMIDVALLKKWFPGFTYTVKDETIQLSDAG